MEMLKTITGLWPFVVVLAVIGIAIWWLLGREMALGRWLLGGFLFAHGWVHVMFVMPRPAPAAATAGGPEWPFDMSRSWVVTAAGLDPSLVRLIGVVLVVVVAVGFLLAGLATAGILVPSGWWQALVVASAAASALLLALFLSPQLVLGVAIDAVLLWVVLAAVWAPTTAATS
jgi:hypothetical protein